MEVFKGGGVMTYEIISSSSKGNCIIVNKYFALDMGIPYSKIKPYLKDLRVVFISHSHSQTTSRSQLSRS